MESYNRAAADVSLGQGVNVHGFANLYGCSIGDETSVGAFVEIQTTSDRRLQTAEDWELVGTIVRRRVSIGSGAVILAGPTIGEGALIGAGSVVTKDVPDGQIVAGNPARALHHIQTG